MQTTTIEQISAISTFEQVPKASIEWMVDKGFVRTFSPKEILFEPGSKAEYFFIVLDGEFHTYVFGEKGKKYANSFGKDTVSGVLPFSRIKDYQVLCHSCEESNVFFLHRDELDEMIRNHYELTACLVHTMTSRVREFTKIATQNEKLMALGKMSAGLAHELNNPASAMARSGKELKKHLTSVPEKFKKLMTVKMDEDIIDRINLLLHEKINAPLKPLSVLEKSNLEDDLLDFFEEKGLDDADDIVGAFIDYQIEEEDLEEMFEILGEQHFNSTIEWIGSQLITEKMVQDIQDASERISSLISSIKSFSYMDRSQDMQPTDIHEGIQSTVKLLEHKIQKEGHTLVLDFSENLPKVKAMPGELNQVWMNIIANAIDAFEEEKGKITIRTSFDDDNVKVNIIDTGKGIPEEIKSRIFEPFFTTKGIGKGTGLGLDITKKVIDKHQGGMKVNSTPGNTEFKITLPIENTI